MPAPLNITLHTIEAIRRRYNGGNATQRYLAECYGISRNTVAKIIHNREPYYDPNYRPPLMKAESKLQRKPTGNGYVANGFRLVYERPVNGQSAIRVSDIQSIVAYWREFLGASK